MAKRKDISEQSLVLNLGLEPIDSPLEATSPQESQQYSGHGIPIQADGSVVPDKKWPRIPRNMSFTSQKNLRYGDDDTPREKLGYPAYH